MKGFFGGKEPAKPDPGAGFFTGNAEIDRQNVEILLRAIAAVNSAVDLQATLNSVVDGAIQLTKTERGILLLFDEFGELRIRVARDFRGNDLPGDIQFSHGIPRRVMEEDRAVYSVVTSDEEAFQLGTSVMELKLRAVMCVPLKVEGKILGVVYVDSKAGSREFTSLDLSLFEALAQQVTVSMERARAQEMKNSLQVARDIQTSLFPSNDVGCEGLDFSAMSRSCDETNGDYHQLFPISETRVGSTVADVTGHGIGPALLVARTQAFLEAFTSQGKRPGDVVFQLNNALESGMKSDNFVTLFYSEIDIERRKLSYANAGHPPALLFRRQTGVIESLPKTGIPLGIQRDFQYRFRDDIGLNPGDLLLLYTDGLTEAMNESRQPFGQEELEKCLRDDPDRSAADLTEHVLRRIQEHTEGARIEDDMTMVVIKITAG